MFTQIYIYFWDIHIIRRVNIDTIGQKEIETFISPQFKSKWYKFLIVYKTNNLNFEFQ